MSDFIVGDDGLPASIVGEWAKTKHDYLVRYLNISRGARRKFLNGPAGSATFIDLFCGPGRSFVKDTGEWIDGSAVAAWKISKDGGAPFSRIYIADTDLDARNATFERLRKLGAPAHELEGRALEAASTVVSLLNPFALHFAFIDPFNLGNLDFRIIQSLSQMKRIDMLIHVSKMDHQRNLISNIETDESALDAFAPGWRERVDTSRPQLGIRQQILEFWKELVAGTGKRPSNRMELIKGKKGQHLYWLLLAAENDLAHKFWNEATKTDQQELF